MSIEQYLSRYAEQDASRIAVPPSVSPVQHVLVIPAKDEPIGFITRLRDWLSTQPAALAIVVVNQSDTTLSADNQALLSWLKDHAAINVCENDSTAHHWLSCGSSYLLAIDKATQPINPKQGVGLARKLGCDIALALYHQGAIKHPWIHCSDADVHFPDGYFEAAATANTKQDAALIYPFAHHQTQHGNAIQLYELRQYYYAQGLAWAGSPYGFTTVGSTLGINAAHYAKVRGFPKLAAGEDFHILNKLAKTGTIRPLSSPILAIEDRISMRVPFGTGPTLAKLQDQTLADIALFEPSEAFFTLKTLLSQLPLLWKMQDVEQMIDSVTAIIGEMAFKAINVEKGLRHAVKQSKSENQFIKQWHSNVDALATLRLIHALTDHKHINAMQLLQCDTPWLKPSQIERLINVTRRKQ